ncbi:MAG: pirin family protein [Acidimicrobiales bacterium]
MDEPAPAILQSHLAEVGGLPVYRALPQRGRRMVGAWCFLDRFGPINVTPLRTMAVGPHPHIGIHTVTWLLAGQVHHSDSLGTQQPIRPAQLNLMTAGAGIVHAEDSRGQAGGVLDGVQLWVAQPEATRHDPPSFAHHSALPVVDLGTARGTVLIGTFGASSPARVDTPLVGVEIAGGGALHLPLDPTFEHGIFVLHGGVRIAGSEASPNQLAYLGAGCDDIELDLADGARVLLLGGRPFAEDILMWWNFVARDRDEIAIAYADWQFKGRRFPPVASTLDRIEAPRPNWLP